MLTEAWGTKVPTCTTDIEGLPVKTSFFALHKGRRIHFRNVPADRQVREILMHGVLIEPETYSSAINETLYKRQADRVVSAAVGGLEMSHYFEDRHRSRIPVDLPDLRGLLLLCGDVESNPGPTDRKHPAFHQGQEADEVSR